MRARVVVAVCVALIAGCSSGGTTPDGVTVAAGWTVEVVRDDLDGPTQVVADPVHDDTVWLAELAGGEDAGAGRARRIDLVTDPGAEGSVEPPRLTRLLTPTGIAVQSTSSGPLLAAQEQRVVTVVPLDPEGDPTAAPREVGGRPPFNGRSQGTLTALGDGRVLRVVTGTGSGPKPAEGSGVLAALDLDTGDEILVATGFKNAYAHAIGPDDTLWVTEIGDGTYDGEAPPDELYAIPSTVWRAALDASGAPFDGGWPRCTGDADPTEAFGVTRADCEALPRPLALFPPRATPTSVAVTTGGRVLVALWVENRVVEVDPGSGEVTDVVARLDRPQHLLARDDGSVLLTVHGAGQLLRLTPP